MVHIPCEYVDSYEFTLLFTALQYSCFLHRYRSLNLSVQMYLEIIKHGETTCFITWNGFHESNLCIYVRQQPLISILLYSAPARLVMCDMLQGSVERIISSNWLLQLLEKLRVSRLAIQKRQQSYLVTTQVNNIYSLCSPLEEYMYCVLQFLQLWIIASVAKARMPKFRGQLLPGIFQFWDCFHASPLLSLVSTQRTLEPS